MSKNLITNVDPQTGIHYGVISANTPESFIWEDFNPVYETECPECGTVSTDSECPECGVEFGDFYGDPSYWEYTGDKEYTIEYAESLNAFFVTRSPYYTFVALCSPCAPNAGDLDTPRDETRGAVKAYCLGHDFFEGNTPYQVFSVKTGKPVITKRFTYHVDLDERGYFMAHVGNSNGDTVISWDLPEWNCDICGEIEKTCKCEYPFPHYVENWDILSPNWGIMEHNRDVKGLCSHLVESGILPKGSELILTD